jgi:hypothetical protein
VPSRLEPLTAAGLASVIETDRETFGGTRGAALEWAFGDAPQYACTARSVSAPTGYCLGRHGRMFDQIGPVVASDDHHAYALVRGALAAAGGRPVAIDAFDGRREFTAMLRRIGFVPQRPLIRMRRDPGASIDRVTSPARTGDSAAPGGNGGSGAGRDKPTTFAIFGPEFG